MTEPVHPKRGGGMPLYARVALALCLCLPLPGVAGGAPLQGVWSGRIGGMAVMACFNGAAFSRGFGSYYYLAHLQPIGLTQRDDGLLWHEARETGVWALDGVRGDALDGVWRNPATQRTLPIRLQRIDGADDPQACARASYNARLERTPVVETGKLLRFAAGRTYRKLRFAGEETLQLEGATPAIARINAAIAPDRSAAAVQAYFARRREALGRGMPEEDETSAQATYWDRAFVTVAFYRWIAGTGRDGISNTYRTWSLRTGEEIDLWQWIGASARKPVLPVALKAWLYRDVGADPACNQGYRGQGVFVLQLGKGGMHFDEEAWGSGCEQSFFVSYRELWPYLTPAGRRAAEAILSQED